MTMPSQKTRAWIYRCLVAAGAILVGHHLIDGSMLTLYLGLAGEFLGVGLAAANTSTKEV